jgi:putative transposase
MVALIFNQVLRVDGEDLHGFFRIVAAPAAQPTVWLAYISALPMLGEDEKSTAQVLGSLTQVARATLAALAESGRVAPVELQPLGKLLTPSELLESREKALWESRQRLMAPFLDHGRIAQALEKTWRIGSLVRAALESGEGNRATVYRLWRLLCQHGFDASSLNPRFERCGAPGVLRPHREGMKKIGRKTTRERLQEPDPSPQRPVTELDRTKILHYAKAFSKPGMPLSELYVKIINTVYVTEYERTADGLRGIPPAQGTFPNLRQVRHIIESGVDRLERKLRKTTQGHFERNHRGLRGKSYDGVPGPGHAYAIDATIGDIYLRSAVNPAWIIGRPIVYMVVDVWSTAIVGFYVCLFGPSWRAAKLALFSAFCDPKLLAELWGFEFVEVLNPAPTVPFHIWTDRGEYLSTGARETCQELAINFAINPPYRPDMKGLVEVLHRITRDKPYPFLPGAINARRKELELRTDAVSSVFTLREYVQYLHSTFVQYNLFSQRENRLSAEMIGAGVQPTPAGLWRFGHEVGVGYRKAMPQDRLITGLLERGSAVVRRDGVFHESLQYEAPIAMERQWTAHARNFGVMEHSVYRFSGNVSRFWWPDPEGRLHEFKLRANARAPTDISFDEWRDALMVDKCQQDDRDYERLKAKLANLEHTEALRARAVARTAAADAAYVGPKPTVREARMLDHLAESGPSIDVEGPHRAQLDQAGAADESSFSSYDALMDEVFSNLNREARP